MASDRGEEDESGDPGMGHSVGEPDGGEAEAAESDVDGLGEPRDGGARRVGRDEVDPPTGSPPGAAAGTPASRAVYDAEHALEWLQRARGHLLAFHHAVGHAMDKLAAAETDLREAGHDDLADRVRDDLLPAGVTDRGAWSYEVLEGFEAGPLADVERFERDVRGRMADGERHVAERAQQERWRKRAER